MEHYVRHFGPWASRLFLSLGALDFGTTGFVYLQEPVLMAWNHDIGMWSAAAKTVTRVQFGAFPLAIAGICLLCLTAPRRFMTGISLLCFLSLASLATYGYGLSLDGFHPHTAMLFKRQAMVACVYCLGVLLEWYRRRAVALALRTPLPVPVVP